MFDAARCARRCALLCVDADAAKSPFKICPAVHTFYLVYTLIRTNLAGNATTVWILTHTYTKRCLHFRTNYNRLHEVSSFFLFKRDHYVQQHHDAPPNRPYRRTTAEREQEAAPLGSITPLRAWHCCCCGCICCRGRMIRTRYTWYLRGTTVHLPICSEILRTFGSENKYETFHTFSDKLVRKKTRCGQTARFVVGTPHAAACSWPPVITIRLRNVRDAVASLVLLHACR